MSYDPGALRDFFDAYGENEWHRLEASLQGRIKFAIHCDVLDRHLESGMKVLDVGCGPGRFAVHMAKAGARLTLADISDRQLDLARRTIEEARVSDSVHGFHRLDVLSMDVFEDASFDLVVCFGSVLSYTREHFAAAVQELKRVTKPGGVILMSVTGLYGTLRLIGPLDAAASIESPAEHLEWQRLLEGGGVVLTKLDSDEFHQPMVLFDSKGFAKALEDEGLQILDFATSNPLLSQGAKIPRIENSDAAAGALGVLERALCRCPGLLDAGEHLIAAARRP